MIIENNLLAVTNAMFKDKKNWNWVNDEQKNDFFFIINRLLAKRFPEKVLKKINKFPLAILAYKRLANL